MVKTPRKWRGFKVAGIVLGIILILLTSSYLWLTYRSGHIIQEIVARESNGRIKTEIGRFTFNYRNLKMDIVDLRLTGADEEDSSHTFRFTAPRLSLQLKSFWSFVWYKQLDIDSIICISPGIELYKLRRDEKRSTSISEEIGKVYVAIQGVLNSLDIKRMEIRKGRVKITERSDPSDTLSLSDIYFRVDNLHVDTTRLDEQPFLFSDNIILQTNNQDISWDNGDRRLRFSRFYINTKENLIEIDSCYISGAKKDINGGSFTILVDSLKLINPNFQALYQSDNLQVDSIYCFNPKLNLQLVLKDNDIKKKNSRQVLENILQNLTGDLAVKYVGVKNADLSVLIQKNDRVTSFNSSQNNFSLNNIVINNNNEQPVTVGHIDLAIRNYLTYTPDSTYTIRFDSIHIIRDKMILNNFTISTSDKASVKLKGTYSIKRFILTDVSWADLLLDRRLDAREATLYQPDIRIEILKNDPAKGKLSLYQVFSILNDNFQLERFRIRDGSIYYKPAPGMLLRIDHVNADVDAQTLLESENIGNIGEAFSRAGFSKLSFRNNKNHFLLDQVRFNGDSQLLQAEKLEFSDAKQQNRLQADGLKATGLAFENNILLIDSVSWQKGEINLTRHSDSAAEGSSFPFKVGHLTGNRTPVLINTGKFRVNAFLEKIILSSLSNGNGSAGVGGGAMIDGNHLQVTEENVLLECDSFAVRDETASYLYGLSFRNTSPDNSFTISAPSVLFAADLRRLIQGKEFLVKTVKIDQPTFQYRRINAEDTLSITVTGKGSDTEEAVIIIDSVRSASSGWAAFLRTWKLYDLQLINRKKHAPFLLTLSSFGLDSVQISNHLIRNPADLFLHNEQLVLKNVSGTLLSPSHIIDWKNIYYNNARRFARVENFSYSPSISRDSFVADHPWETDYIKAGSGAIELFNVDPGQYLRNKILKADNILVHEPEIEVYRDKRLPFQAGIIKPLPAGLINRIPIQLSVDTLTVRNGYVGYTELSDKTQQEGKIFFSQLNALLFGFKNHDHLPADTFKLKATAWLLDTAWVKLMLQQPYTDTPAGFVMDVRMRPTQLAFLNPMLVPAVSLKLVSGQLDTLHLKAFCSDDVASGEITLFYHDLKVALLKQGDETRKSFWTGAASFLANKLLIKRKNGKRTEPIVFHRNRDRSVFNYWIKITMRGVAASVGIKMNKGELRRYRSNYGQPAVPDIDF